MRLLALAPVVLLLGFQEAAHPLDVGLKEVSSKMLEEILGYLAGDELEGRCAGFPGNDKASAYIAERFQVAGLKAVGDPDDQGKATYWQYFKIRRGELTTRNCLGFLPGSDPVLKDEIIVVGAHHDHVGKFGQQRAGQLGEMLGTDNIWNGADDNGSGTTALLGIVKAFSAVSARPKRSILFITFSAEEWGLLGSRHYVEHPLLPLDRTVAMFNMDMVGRTDEENTANAYGLGTAEGDRFRPLLELAAKRHGLKFANLDPHFGDGSDHISFFGKGLPVCGISEKGPCPDYHRVTDSPEKIAYGTMERIARTAAQFVWDLADYSGTIRRDAAYRRPAPKEAGKPRLGAYLEAVEGDALKALALGPGRGAMSVNGFVEGAVAVTQGVKEGDILISFNGETFDEDRPREKLTKNLERIIRGEPVALELIRDGKALTLPLTWPLTETDHKIKALIEEYVKTGSPEAARKLAEFGDEAEPRVSRLDPAIAGPLLDGIAVRKAADKLHESWGTRWFVYRDASGKGVGTLRISVAKSKAAGEPLEVTAESRLWGEWLVLRAVCERDGRLTLREASLEGSGGVRKVFPDSTIAESLAGSLVHPHVLLLVATARPSLFSARKLDPTGGRTGVTVSLKDEGDHEVDLGEGKRAKRRKIAYREEGRAPSAIWLDESGRVARMDGPGGRLEASTQAEAEAELAR